jgi:hypothetical protein
MAMECISSGQTRGQSLIPSCLSSPPLSQRLEPSSMSARSIVGKVEVSGLPLMHRRFQREGPDRRLSLLPLCSAHYGAPSLRDTHGAEVLRPGPLRRAQLMPPGSRRPRPGPSTRPTCPRPLSRRPLWRCTQPSRRSGTQSGGTWWLPWARPPVRPLGAGHPGGLDPEVSPPAGHLALSRLRMVMQADPTGREILAERPNITEEVVGLERLRTLPEGTFGREYARYLDAHT